MRRGQLDGEEQTWWHLEGIKEGDWGLTFIAGDWLPAIQAQSGSLIDGWEESPPPPKKSGCRTAALKGQNFLPKRGPLRCSLMIKNVRSLCADDGCFWCVIFCGLYRTAQSRTQRGRSWNWIWLWLSFFFFLLSFYFTVFQRKQHVQCNVGNTICCQICVIVFAQWVHHQGSKTLQRG